MGLPMARNLAKNLNVRPRGYDVNAAVLESTADWATVCGSPREVPVSGGLVASMLPADRHVKEVALGADGLNASQATDFIYADFSTISPDTIKFVGAQLESRKIKTIGGACTLGVAA